MKRVLARITLLLSLLTFFITGVYAAGGILLSTEGFEKQEKSNWCWVASAHNSVHYETKLHRTQKAAVKHLKGTSTEPYPNLPGTVSEIEQAAEYISWNREYYISSYSAKNFDFLKRQVDLDNVTIASAGYYNNNNVRTSGHAVVITGYYISNNNEYSIVYFDPWDEISYTCTYTEFCNGAFNNRRYDATCYNMEE